MVSPTSPNRFVNQFPSLFFSPPPPDPPPPDAPCCFGAAWRCPPEDAGAPWLAGCCWAALQPQVLLVGLSQLQPPLRQASPPPIVPLGRWHAPSGTPGHRPDGSVSPIGLSLA